MGPESYRIRRNNAKYTAITPFKVIQGDRFWYQSKAHLDLDFLLVNNTNVPRILHRFRDMADYWSNFLSDRVRFLLTHWLRISPDIRINSTSSETRMIVLPDSEDRTILSSLAWTKHRNVTDGRTDRRTDRQPVATAVCIASRTDKSK